MTTFSASTEAEAVVPASRQRVWDVVTDPAQVAALTPFISGIEPDGDHHWVWHMSGLNVLGRGFSATFTERMTFTDGVRMEFHHEPPDGSKERAGVHGWYDLADEGPDAVRLATTMQICVDLPLPRVSGPAVRTAMRGVIAGMGDRFSKNLLAHLGVG